MKPENLPKSSYDYEVYVCPTPERLQQVLEQNKDRAGFYWYAIPQDVGCLLVVATANLEVIKARTQPRIELGLKPLKEHEAKSIVIEKGMSDVLTDHLDTIITLLYERGYEICKRVEKEA